MATIQEILEQKKGDPITVSQDMSVADATRFMSENKVGCVLVLRNEKLKGLFTERDLLNKVIAIGKDPSQTHLKDVMTSKVAVGNRDMGIQEAGELMSGNRIRHLPIVEDGKLIDVISSGDILAWQLKEHQTTVRHLENYFLT